MKPTKIYDTYWDFAIERMKIFYGHKTEDPILQEYKFTNCFRATDRVSQYLIRHVIYGEGLDMHPSEVVFRILLFKTFNKIETWELMCRGLGYTPTEKRFSFDKYTNMLHYATGPIFNGAYIAPTGQPNFGSNCKYRNHLRLVEHFRDSYFFLKLDTCRSLEEVYHLFKAQPMFGPFLAMQLSIDMNYSTVINFDEDDFIVPGLGAKRGIKRCFGQGADVAGVFKYVQADPRMNEVQLYGRRLKLIDLQNLFCEVDKYSREKHPEAGGKRIKQKYKPSGRGHLSYFFPPKWELVV